MKRGLKIGTEERDGRIGLYEPIVLVALVLVACSEEPARERRPEALEPAPAPLAPSGYDVIQVPETGSVAGEVRWLGPLSALDMLPVRVHRESCGDVQPSPALRVSPRGDVAGAVVWLADVHAGLAIEHPAEPVPLAIEGCRFVPHVLAVPVGASIQITNLDPVLHNVHAYDGDETVWNFGLPEEGRSERRTIDAPGALRVVSDVHSWMLAWIHAFEHPYFAVSGEDGRFRISGVPPGQYVLRVWHEGWRIVGTDSGRPRYSRPVLLSRTVSVSAQQETTLDFELSRASAEIAGE